MLSRAQERFVADRGQKQNHPPLLLNGKERVQIKTIHGGFEFAEQRFLLPDDSSCRYLKRTGQGLHSSGIEEFCLYYCNRLSFAEVSKKLLERVSGGCLLCEQTLWNWVQSKACEVSTALSSEVCASRSLPMPTFGEALDIYDEAGSEEVLVSTDAIHQVKAQKPTRERRRWGADYYYYYYYYYYYDTQQEKEKKVKKKVKKKRINTDLMLVQGKDGVRLAIFRRG